MNSIVRAKWLLVVGSVTLIMGGSSHAMTQVNQQNVASQVMVTVAGVVEDCNGNGVADGDDIAGGTSEDCNGSGVPDECEAGQEGNGFGDSSAWGAFNLQTYNLDHYGYAGAIADDGYVYFLHPWEGAATLMLRYDSRMGFSDPGAWVQSYQVASHGYYCGASDGSQYVYFAPAASKVFLQLDTSKDFTAAEAWTAYSPLSSILDSGGFAGATNDGSRYIYFAPNGHGQMIRFDTWGDFGSDSSWAAFEIGGTGLVTSVGYEGAVFDGTYMYFVPHRAAASGAWHSEVVRYDTRLDFSTSASWAAFDVVAAGVATTAGMSFGAFDGERYIYFGPAWGGATSVVRYDTLGDFNDTASWTAHDITAYGDDPDTYRGVVCDGRFVYLLPYHTSVGGHHSEVLRYDSSRDFTSPSSWQTHDPDDDGLLHDTTRFLNGGFDGRYVYLAPENDDNAHEEVVRYDVTYGWSPDCNTNGVPDECELAGNDCNTNGVPDDCDLDSDGDGFIDDCDNCPAVSNPDQLNFDRNHPNGDDLGDACDDDVDADGMVNEMDQCPFTIAEATMDDCGCPEYIPGDIDRDGDVDLMDFAILESCLTGPNAPGDPDCAMVPPPCCQ